MEMDYDKYSKDIENATNSINLKEAISTQRKGGAGFRDKFVFGRISWTEALSYISIIQSVVIFTALIPDSVTTVNEFLEWIGIPIQFPLEISSVAAVFFIITVFIFGLVAIRYLGTSRRGSEVTGKLNPSYFLLWQKLEHIEKRLDKFERNDENRYTYFYSKKGF